MMQIAPMRQGPSDARAPQARDPYPWQMLISLIFALLVMFRLTTPHKLMFDEIHYIPAARALLDGLPANPEHPLLAKEALALSLRLLGDTPLAWRLPSAIMGWLGLLSFGRALWWISHRPMASMAAMVLLGTNFAWYVQSRIAMLDMVMAGFAMLGLALWARAACKPDSHPAARLAALAAGGISFGLALGAKWSALPVYALAVAALLVWRWQQHGGRHKIGWAVLLFYAVALPLMVYWLTFWPAFHYLRDPISPWDPLGWHRTMRDLQASVVKAHPYQTRWLQWVIDQRGIWYLYEPVEGAQRGVIMLGNPFTMLAGLPALVWCLWQAWAARRRDTLLVALAYLASLGLWIVANKPVQFYYHYLLPGSFLMAALALALDALWHSGPRWRQEAVGVVLLSIGMFVWFFPILSAAPLAHGPRSFEYWMWLDSWR